MTVSFWDGECGNVYSALQRKRESLLVTNKNGDFTLIMSLFKACTALLIGLLSLYLGGNVNRFRGTNLSPSGTCPSSYTYGDLSGYTDEDWYVDGGTCLNLMSTSTSSVAIPDFTESEEKLWRTGTCFSDITIVYATARITGIGDYAFMGFTSLQRATFSGSVSSLGIYCFSGCTSLTSISFGSLTTPTIPDYAFYQCSALPFTFTGTGMTSIGRAAFAESGITSANLSASPDLESIGANAFQSCTSLETCLLPEGITSLPEYMLDGCTKLTDFTIPETVTSIGGRCFLRCSAWSSESVLPSGISSIGLFAFYQCEAWSGSVDSSVMTSISQGAFGGSGIKSVAISGRSSLGIGSSAFQSCTALETCVLPEGITSLPQQMLIGCTNLTEFIIPTTVTSVGDGCLSSCSGLTSVTYLGETALENNFLEGCDALTNENIILSENYPSTIFGGRTIASSSTEQSGGGSTGGGSTGGGSTGSGSTGSGSNQGSGEESGGGLSTGAIAGIVVAVIVVVVAVVVAVVLVLRKKRKAASGDGYAGDA